MDATEELPIFSSRFDWLGFTPKKKREEKKKRKKTQQKNKHFLFIYFLKRGGTWERWGIFMYDSQYEYSTARLTRFYVGW